MKRPFLIFSFYYCIFQPLAAQESSSITIPPFVQLEANHLDFSTDSSAFMSLFNKMDKMRTEKQKRLNIVHIGGSHVQAGLWSNAFLANLQLDYKTIGGGYFGFPYKLAKTNGQSYLSTFSDGKWKKCRAVWKDYCLPLGMSGLSISTNDSVCFFGAALTPKAVCRYVNNIRVYHNFNASFQFKVRNADTSKVSRTDRPESGYSVFSFRQPVDSVIFDLVRIDTLVKDFVLYGYSFENDLTSGYYLAALGLNGASSSSFLRCSEMSKQLPTLNADLFILSLGVNDTQAGDFTKENYIANYDSLITLIRTASPDAAIMLTTTTDNYIRKKHSNKRTGPARDAMYDLAQKHHVAVWDLYTVMGGHRSISKWNQAGLASKDRVHFTPRGYVLLGQLMYQALITSYNRTQIHK